MFRIRTPHTVKRIIVQLQSYVGRIDGNNVNGLIFIAAFFFYLSFQILFHSSPYVKNENAIPNFLISIFRICPIYLLFLPGSTREWKPHCADVILILNAQKYIADVGFDGLLYLLGISDIDRAKDIRRRLAAISLQARS